jgi:hypothetical protein
MLGVSHIIVGAMDLLFILTDHIMDLIMDMDHIMDLTMDMDHIMDLIMGLTLLLDLIPILNHITLTHLLLLVEFIILLLLVDQRLILDSLRSLLALILQLHSLLCILHLTQVSLLLELILVVLLIHQAMLGVVEAMDTQVVGVVVVRTTWKKNSPGLIKSSLNLVYLPTKLLL